MQRYTIFFIAVNALHVQAVFPPIIRSSNYTYSIWYMSSLLAATVSVGELAGWHCQLTHTSGNMYSIDSNKEYSITLHLVGYTKRNVFCFSKITAVQVSTKRLSIYCRG